MNPMDYEQINIFEEDFWKLKNILTNLKNTLDARLVLLIDRAGQLIASAGDPAEVDVLAFSSLTAADYAATSHLASLIGENEFSNLHHQGTRHNIYIQIVNDKFILAIISKAQNPLGRVKVETLRTKEKLTEIFIEISKKMEEGKQSVLPSEDISSEIDNFLEDFFNNL